MNQEDYIRKNYKKIPSKKIAEGLGISYQKVQSIARYIGVAQFSTKIQNIVEYVLEDYYLYNKTVKEICKKFQIGKSTILDILRLRGSGGRKPHETGIVYKCNVNFFDRIDTPEKAYWFGFIAADGNIYNGKLQIRLHTKDKNHLEKFCDRIEYNGTIFKEKDKEVVGIIISRQKLIQDLKKHGLTENKTEFIDKNIFNSIPRQFIPAAMHGYFDGDGSFSISRNAVSFSLLGNKSFLQFWQQELQKYNFDWGKSKITKDKRTKHTYYLNKYLIGDNLILMREFFYENKYSSQDFLDRKRKKLYKED